MKKILFLAAIVYSCAASATVIQDDYIGSDDHGDGDVIGRSDWFDINFMDVTLSGTQMTVSIDTNLADGTGGLGSYGYYTQTDWGNYNGIGYGFLFLSSDGWDPYGSAPYLADDSTTAPQWEYVVSMENQWTTGDTTGALYAITYGQTEILLSDDFISGNPTFRNGQEVAINTAGENAISGADITTGAGLITFNFDIAGTDLNGADAIGLHWAMTCGNDTIEGEFTPVPEPSTVYLMLLGFGLLVGTTVRRRVAPQPATASR